jgi:membrane-associated phospholipid phosphatase
MHIFSNLGHSVILAPLSLILIFYLLSIGARRDALAFAVALIACLTVTLFSKLFFGVCGARAPDLHIESPSGHESFSGVVYGCLAVLLATGRPKRLQALIYTAAALLFVLIGVGRVASRAHTPEEVAVGLLIGVGAAALFRSLRGQAGPFPVPWRALAFLSPFALAFGFVALLAARNWTPEYFIEAVGQRLGAHFGVCI